MLSAVASLPSAFSSLQSRVADAPTPARQRRQRIDGSFGAAELVD
jgi:hypothetical protein